MANDDMLQKIQNLNIDTTLTHHGIKGQKWGLRRFQNPDGSLTPAGRERYGSKGESISNWIRGKKAENKVTKAGPVSKEAKATQSKINNLDSKEKRRIFGKDGKIDLSQLSPDELRAVNERIRLEQEFHKLTTGNAKPKKTVVQTTQDILNLLNNTSGIIDQSGKLYNSAITIGEFLKGEPINVNRFDMGEKKKNGPTVIWKNDNTDDTDDADDTKNKGKGAKLKDDPLTKAVKNMSKKNKQEVVRENIQEIQKLVEDTVKLSKKKKR